MVVQARTLEFYGHIALSRKLSNKAWSPERPMCARVAPVVFLHESFYCPVFRPVRVLNCSTN
jgi:hypothetical protein